MTGRKQILTLLQIRGTVQGVFFRSKTKKYADQLGLKGYVKNLPNGMVEIAIVGETVDPLIKLLKSEPPPIQIDEIVISSYSTNQNYTDFSIQ